MKKHLYTIATIAALVMLLVTPWKVYGDKIGALWNGTYYLDLYSVVTGTLTGTVTVSDNTTDATQFPLLAGSATGSLVPRTSSVLTYNRVTGLLSSTLFGGALNGTVGATTPAAGTFTTLFAGGAGGNCTISATGDMWCKGAATAASFNATRHATNPMCTQWFAGTNYDDNYTEFCAPNTGYSATTRYYWPVNAPSGNQIMVFPTPTGNASQGTWGSASFTKPILNIALRGGGTAITTGSAGSKRIAAAATITGYTILSTSSCSITVDLWKTTYTAYDGTTHPANGDSITSSAPITLTTAYKAKDETLTGWTKTLAADDIVHVNIDSSDCTGDVDIQVYGTRSL